MDAQHQQATRFLGGVHKEHAQKLYNAGWRITRPGKWGHEKYGEHSMEDAIDLHHTSEKTSQHSEEVPEVEPGHVTPERAQELVNQTPGGWIRR